MELVFIKKEREKNGGALPISGNKSQCKTKRRGKNSIWKGAMVGGWEIEEVVIGGRK